MGNRAVIAWANAENYQTKVGVYLHWNGGLTSVESFLNYCRMKGYPAPDKDSYGLASFIQVVTNFLGGGSSVAVDLCVNLDCNNYDNGLYLCKGWEHIEHLFTEPYADRYDPQDFLRAIDEKMPKEEQLGNMLNAYQVAFEDLEIGDHVFVKNYHNERVSELPVLGFGDGVVNGRDCTGLPFVDRFNRDNGEFAKSNTNCYVCLKFDKLENTTGIPCADGYCYAIKKADL